MLLDNKTHGKVGDELRRAIEPESKVAILSGLFTVFGFAALKSELAKIERLKLLLADDDAILPSQLAGNADEIGLKNELNLQHIASECAQWVRRKAEVRALSGAPIRQNLFHVRQPSGSAIAISGTSDLTASGLGMVPSAAFAMNTVAGDGDNPKCFPDLHAARHGHRAGTSSDNRARAALGCYQRWYRQRYRKHLNLTAPMMVLNVTTTEARLVRMLDLTEGLFPEGNSYQLFLSWDAFGAVFMPPEPNVSLLTDCWRSVGEGFMLERVG